MEKNKVGRPVKYETPEEMQKLVDEYFEKGAYVEVGDKMEFRPTVTGLALALDLTREGLCSYSGKKEFSDTVKKAKARVELAIEQKLYGNSVAGLIFNLKNNFGWKDKTETEHSGMIGLSDMTDDQLDRRINELLNK